MLKINLLPPEYREPDRMPVGVLLVIMLCTVLSVSSMCTVGWLYFIVLNEAESARDIAREEQDSLAPMARYADQLEKEKTEYMKRSQVIKEIETTRILWTKKLDQLMDVINNDGNREAHWVWLEELKINMAGRGANQPGAMNLKGFTVGDQIKPASQFNRDLRNHELFQEDFDTISNPTGETVEDDKKLPAMAIAFDWEMTLKNKTPKPPAKKPAAKPVK